MTNEEALFYLQCLEKENKLYGEYNNISNEVYHSNECPGISSSRLKTINRSIYHYIHSISNKKSSEAMNFGSAFHDAILLPELYKDKYAVMPKCDKRTKEGKEIAMQFLSTSKDKTILDHDDAIRIEQMASRIRESNAVKHILSQGKAETSFWWNDEDLGTLCKCRADWLYTDGINTVLVDIKTTSKSISKNKFTKSIIDYQYDLSGAFYIDGINKCLGTNITTMAIIAIESEPPYDVGLFCLGPNAIKTGRELYKNALRKYNEYLIDPIVSKLSFANKDFELIDIPEWATNIDNRKE